MLTATAQQVVARRAVKLPFNLKRFLEHDLLFALRTLHRRINFGFLRQLELDFFDIEKLFVIVFFYFFHSIFFI